MAHSDHIPTKSQSGQAAFQLLLDPIVGKTIQKIILGDGPDCRPNRARSEVLLIQFTDGSELRLMIGTNINTLGNEQSGYQLRSASELDAWLVVV